MKHYELTAIDLLRLIEIRRRRHNRRILRTRKGCPVCYRVEHLSDCSLVAVLNTSREERNHERI